MDKIKESNNLNDKNLLNQQNNSNNKEDILQTINMREIYCNLFNDEQIKLPNFNGFSNFLSFFDYFFNQIMNKQDNKILDLSRTNEILILLIEELMKQALNVNQIQINDQKKLEQYFLDKNFFDIFSEILKRIEDLFLFKEVFTKFSEVSNNIYNYVFVLDDTKYFKR